MPFESKEHFIFLQSNTSILVVSKFATFIPHIRLCDSFIPVHFFVCTSVRELRGQRAYGTY